MRTKKLAFCFLAVLVAGCVPVVSLRPLFTKDEITFDDKLVGTWAEDANDPAGTWTWEFSRLDEADAGGLLQLWQVDITKSYRLTLTDSEGHPAWFAACLVKLGDRRFLDVFPGVFPLDEQDTEKMTIARNALLLQPVHTIIRVDSISEKLAIRMTDDAQFRKLIEAEPAAVKHEVVDDRPILTASTKDLQTFVTKYAGDERLFPNDLTLTRKTKSPAP